MVILVVRRIIVIVIVIHFDTLISVVFRSRDFLQIELDFVKSRVFRNENLDKEDKEVGKSEMGACCSKDTTNSGIQEVSRAEMFVYSLKFSIEAYS